MIKKTLTSVAFAAGCAIALIVPAAQAQMVDNRTIADDNNKESAQYEHLMQNNPAFLQGRIESECGPITDLQMRLNCIDSIGAAVDERGLDPQEGLTIGSRGTMNSTGAPLNSPNRPIPNAGR